jgi:hypothetical protein
MSQKQRQQRILERRTGTSGTSSSDYFHLVWKLFRSSEKEALESMDGNSSRYVWAGLPMLLAGLIAFVVEQERMLNPRPDPDRLKNLERSLPEMMAELYGLKGELLDALKDLSELRHELIHPAHTATGTPDSWPDYLRHIKNMGVLNTTGNPKSDYIMLSQMASHRMFDWAVEVVGRIYEVILDQGSPGNRALWMLPYIFRVRREGKTEADDPNQK